MPSIHASRDRISHPNQIRISYPTGESAIFILDSGNLIAIDIDLVSKTLNVPSEVVAKLKNIHFDSTVLLWSGSFPKAADSDLVSLRFAVGTDLDRRFGAFPIVDITFEKDKLLAANLKVKTGYSSEESKPIK